MRNRPVGLAELSVSYWLVCLLTVAAEVNFAKLCAFGVILLSVVHIPNN